MSPLVSVIIPTYNRSGLLAEAIESVLAQTWKDLEIIVVDDGSTDNTRDALVPYRTRIKYIFQANSGGCSRPRNVGIRHSNGEYIAFLDSDDIMACPKIQLQVAFLKKHPEVGMVFTDFGTFSDSGTLSESFISSGHSRFLALPRKSVGPNDYILVQGLCDCLALDNFIGTPSCVVVRRRVVQRVGVFDESLYASEDIDMWFRIAQSFAIGFIDLPLLDYRIHGGNIFSSKNKNLVRSHLSRIKVRERFLKSGAISTITRRQLVRRLGGMYLSLADLHLNDGNRSGALFNVWESLKRRPVQLTAYKLACMSFIPQKGREALRIAYRAALNRRAEELASSVQA